MYMWYITLPGIFYEASKEQKPPRYTVKTPSIYGTFHLDIRLKLPRYTKWIKFIFFQEWIKSVIDTKLRGL